MGGQIHISNGDCMHPYACDTDTCIHCTGRKTERHDPDTCALCLSDDLEAADGLDVAEEA